jgi:hypothetical protein
VDWSSLLTQSQTPCQRVAARVGGPGARLRQTESSGGSALNAFAVHRTATLRLAASTRAQRAVSKLTQNQDTNQAITTMQAQLSVDVADGMQVASASSGLSQRWQQLSDEEVPL